jgi:hypothetical protein
MQILTFDEILTKMCDDFDALISPKKMARTNTNIFYLVFKAVSKGFEIINNVCVVLSNKFDPAKCSEEDLLSVASLVGTERHLASATGLNIVVTNPTEQNITLLAGMYTYKFQDDVVFDFEVLSDTVIGAGLYASFIAMSSETGSYHVTAQSEITVTSDRAIPDSLVFSCTDNEALLGVDAETVLAFRKRILEGYDEQDSLVELENRLRNLPYLFDCRVKFNPTDNNITYDGLTIPPYTLAIFFSGSPRNDIAKIIADNIICPTVSAQDAVTVTYESEVFATGSFSYYLIPFREAHFSVEVIYTIDELYISQYDAEKAMRTALIQHFIPEVHKDYVKEEEAYNVLTALNLQGVDILAVNLSQGGSDVDYISVPATRLAKLDTVTFDRQGA